MSTGYSYTLPVRSDCAQFIYPCLPLILLLQLPKNSYLSSFSHYISFLASKLDFKFQYWNTSKFIQPAKSIALSMGLLDQNDI